MSEPKLKFDANLARAVCQTLIDGHLRGDGNIDMQDVEDALQLALQALGLPEDHINIQLELNESVGFDQNAVTDVNLFEFVTKVDLPRHFAVIDQTNEQMSIVETFGFDEVGRIRGNVLNGNVSASFTNSEIILDHDGSSRDIRIVWKGRLPDGHYNSQMAWVKNELQVKALANSATKKPDDEPDAPGGPSL